MTYEELKSELHWEIRNLQPIPMDEPLEQLLMKTYELGEDRGYNQGWDAGAGV